MDLSGYQQDRDGSEGNDGEGTKVGIGDDGSGHRGETGATTNDVVDLGGVDALHVVLFYQVHYNVAQLSACGQRHRERAHCE